MARRGWRSVVRAVPAGFGPGQDGWAEDLELDAPTSVCFGELELISRTEVE
jgi:hypothetical protein